MRMDFAMPDALGVVRRAAERDTTLLIGEILRMHEGEIEEAPFGVGECAVEPAGNRACSDRVREMIGRKGARRALEHVARELVEHDDKGKRPLRGPLPVGQPSCRGAFVIGQEPAHDRGIDVQVAREPFFRAKPAPEAENVRRSREALHRPVARGLHQPNLSEASSPARGRISV